jgi:hypothetical protein
MMSISIMMFKYASFGEAESFRERKNQVTSEKLPDAFRLK